MKDQSKVGLEAEISRMRLRIHCDDSAALRAVTLVGFLLFGGKVFVLLSLVGLPPTASHRLHVYHSSWSVMPSRDPSA